MNRARVLDKASDDDASIGNRDLERLASEAFSGEP